jgi:acyl-CoA reductase-like NAD-dependent aldehyde dehydrogenase
MTTIDASAPVRQPERLFIGGEWVEPSSDARIDVIDSGTEELYYQVAEAQAADIDAAVGAARAAFDDGAWPSLSHGERAGYLRAFGPAISARAEALSQLWPRESGTIYSMAKYAATMMAKEFDAYASLADTFAFEERATPSQPGWGLLVREPVGTVGAIVPWNSPHALIPHKIGPALLAGCTVVLKMSPEAPGAGYVVAEAAEEIGLPAGVLNVVTADREVSELLVRDPRIDKITFTGSTAAGRKIGAILGERIARMTLELGGKSAAVVLDDADIEKAAKTLARAECAMTGQVCSSLTRIVVTRKRHDAMVEALAEAFRKVRVGNQFDEQSQMGPLAVERQRTRVEGYIAKGIEEGATLAAGGKRPSHLARGWFIEPTVFGNVDNAATIAQEEIFGPVLSVIPAADEQDAVRIANDTIYGLNSAVFTSDPDRALAVSRQLRAGTVGMNSFRTDFGIAFGGFKQSGIGREGGKEGLTHFLETKTVILDDPPSGYRDDP